MNICRMLLVIVIIVTMSLMLVWEQNHITKIGYRISSLQKCKVDLTEENRMLEHEVNKLISDDRISQVIKSFNLNLVHAGEKKDMERLYSQANIDGNSFVKGL